MNHVFCGASGMGMAMMAMTATMIGGCATSDGGPDCVAGLLPGALVITEIMANPEGPDEGNEWFEVYNNTGAAIDASGVVLRYTNGSGTIKTHALDGVTIPADAYFVFGGILPEFAPGYIDYGYGGDLGSLGNTSGRLALTCDVIEVDGVDYQEVPSGKSMGLGQTIFPDHNENDDWSKWCEASTEYATDSLGTPGEANECTGMVGAGMCLDGDALRPNVAPSLGDLIITEVMPDSAVISDSDGEWFEIKAIANVDLYGLELGRADGVEFTIGEGSAECRPMVADSYVVFAKNDDPAVNGGIEGAVDYTGVSLLNSNGSLFIGVGGEVLDRVTWASSDSGVSLNLDPEACDTRLNDEAINWCPGDQSNYDQENGNHGSPGATNQSCPPVVEPGFCLDIDTGAVREIVSPAPGDLTITEYMANPGGDIGDTDGEWIEFKANADVDLNQVEVRKLTNTGTADAAFIVPPEVIECVGVTMGRYQVVARDIDAMVNGCISEPVGLFDVSLNNSNNTIFLSVGQDDIDSVSYSSTGTGSSSSLDEVSGKWCYNTTDVYDTCVMSQNTGTPWEANPPCPAP